MKPPDTPTAGSKLPEELPTLLLLPQATSVPAPVGSRRSAYKVLQSVTGKIVFQFTQVCIMRYTTRNTPRCCESRGSGRSGWRRPCMPGDGSAPCGVSCRISNSDHYNSACCSGNRPLRKIHLTQEPDLGAQSSEVLTRMSGYGLRREAASLVCWLRQRVEGGTR
jgi:hypothetical protein